MYRPLVAYVLDSIEAGLVTLNAGVTTVRDTQSRAYIDVHMRDAQRVGQIEGPRIVACGECLYMTGGHGSFFNPENAADGVSGVIRRLRELVGKHVDWVKIVSADDPQVEGRWESEEFTLEVIAAVVSEARRLKRNTMAHAMGPVGISNCVAAGVRTVEHGWYLDEENCDAMVRSGTYLVPTLANVGDIVRKGPALRMSWAPAIADDEPASREHHRMAIEKGVRIVMGTDCGGTEAHLHGSNCDELVCYVECGMSPSQAIVSGTSGAAEALELQDEIGTIEEGKLADIVVIDGDPLSDITLVATGVVGVIQQGRVIRDDLGLLEAMRVRANKPRLQTTTAIDPVALGWMS